MNGALRTTRIVELAMMSILMSWHGAAAGAGDNECANDAHCRRTNPPRGRGGSLWRPTSRCSIMNQWKVQWISNERRGISPLGHMAQDYMAVSARPSSAIRTAGVSDFNRRIMRSLPQSAVQ